MVFPEATRCRCSSSPVIPRICTSAIRQEVRGTSQEFRNSSADAKVWAVYPSDFMSPLIASRIDSSSSTTEIWGFVFDTLPPTSRVSGRTNAQRSEPLSEGYSVAFRKDKAKRGVRRLYFGLNNIAASARVVGHL